MMILLFSNNTNQVSLLKHVLKSHDLLINHIDDRKVIKKEIKDHEYMAVILDLPIPTIEDLLFWKELIEMTPTPILLLSSNRTDAQRVLLRQQASIYLADPVANLLKYLRLVKRNKLNDDVIMLAPGIIFDVAGHCIRKNDECITLSSTEFKILFLLATNYENSFTAQDLMDQVDLAGISTLYVHIQNLRRKIETNPSSPLILINNRGHGYKLQIELRNNQLDKVNNFN
jgi:DNA-binding response OmpR family regulator